MQIEIGLGAVGSLLATFVLLAILPIAPWHSRFSLRDLFISTTLVAVGWGWRCTSRGSKFSAAPSRHVCGRLHPGAAVGGVRCIAIRRVTGSIFIDALPGTEFPSSSFTQLHARYINRRSAH